MIAYGGDVVCSGYDAPCCGGGGWSWGGQAWGAAYEQVQYAECGSGWEQYQQPRWEAAASLVGPKVGAELLTDLRLAELKRLIDRDAKALRDNAKVRSQGNDVDSDSADCTSRAPDSNEGTPTKDVCGDAAVASVGSRGLPAKATAVQEDLPWKPEQGSISSREFPEKGVTKEIAPSQKEEELTTEDTDVATPAADTAPPAAEAASAAAAALAPPGLEAPTEQRLVAVADFLPEGRSYGELPLRAGEEVFVSGEQLDGWIFGSKRPAGGPPDEGWLPASALGLPDGEEAAAGEEEAQPLRPGGGRRGRGRGRQGGATSAPTPAGGGGSGAGGGAGGGGSRKGAPAAAQQQQRGGGAAAPQPRGKGSSRVDAPQPGAEPWHHHGNWWSKQRHLKADKEADNQPRKGPSRPSKQASSQQSGASNQSTSRQSGASNQSSSRQSGPSNPSSSRPSGPSNPSSSRPSGPSNPASSRPSASSDEDEEFVRPAPAVGRNSGGKGFGRGGARPMERQPRERPALTSLLDRLNKPLVAPKPPNGQ